MGEGGGRVLGRRRLESFTGACAGREEMVERAAAGEERQNFWITVDQRGGLRDQFEEAFQHR